MYVSLKKLRNKFDVCDDAWAEISIKLARKVDLNNKIIPLKKLLFDEYLVKNLLSKAIFNRKISISELSFDKELQIQSVYELINKNRLNVKINVSPKGIAGLMKMYSRYIISSCVAETLFSSNMVTTDISGALDDMTKKDFCITVSKIIINICTCGTYDLHI